MAHAFHNAIDAYDLGEGLIMLVGPARDAQMLKIGYITSTDAHVIVHAMKARPRFPR